MDDVYVLDYVRTPRGKGSPRGALHGISPVELTVGLQHALTDRGLDPALVEDVVIGTASQVDEQGANLARTATLLAGWGDSVPGGTVNRFCASGIDAVAQTAARIRAGDLRTAVAGGVESTSPTSRCPALACRTTWRSPRTTRSSTISRCSGTWP
ncbi:hypothetical protein [Streptomyces sp. H39-C1]|uniref:thiolase family protein n=1 Tax=Streptomyces sp. H39-C1 TaxID=3004355 RepID=UPI0022AFAE59|nr:hypothetical protein [Streptomyces sp. H39-C1]MCZ4102673.1 hypothetical protein [Streptomyces sp. H39-C1]